MTNLQNRLQALLGDRSGARGSIAQREELRNILRTGNIRQGVNSILARQPALNEGERQVVAQRLFNELSQVIRNNRPSQPIVEEPEDRIAVIPQPPQRQGGPIITEVEDIRDEDDEKRGELLSTTRGIDIGEVEVEQRDIKSLQVARIPAGTKNIVVLEFNNVLKQLLRNPKPISQLQPEIREGANNIVAVIPSLSAREKQGLRNKFMLELGKFYRQVEPTLPAIQGQEAPPSRISPSQPIRIQPTLPDFQGQEQPPSRISPSQPLPEPVRQSAEDELRGIEGEQRERIVQRQNKQFREGIDNLSQKAIGILRIRFGLSKAVGQKGDNKTTGLDDLIQRGFISRDDVFLLANKELRFKNRSDTHINNIFDSFSLGERKFDKKKAPVQSNRFRQFARPNQQSRRFGR